MGRGSVWDGNEGGGEEEEVLDLGCWMEAGLRGVPGSYDARRL